MIQAFRLIIMVLTLISFSLPVSAESTEWKNPTYKFGTIKKIMISAPTIHYEYRGFHMSGKNYFENYPDVERKVLSLLQDRITNKLPKYQFISAPIRPPVEPAIIKEPPLGSDSVSAPLPTNTPEPIQDPLLIEEPIADAVLAIKIIDMGWFYKYHGPYQTWETVTDEERFTYTDSRGQQREGKRTIRRQVPVYHPAGHDAHDSVTAEFSLQDAKTGAVIWTFVDARTRGGRYDSSGPESMLKRILDAAAEKLAALKS